MCAQSGHPTSIHCAHEEVLSHKLSREEWLVSTDVQADLNLHWAYTGSFACYTRFFVRKIGYINLLRSVFRLSVHHGSYQCIFS